MKLVSFFQALAAIFKEPLSFVFRKKIKNKKEEILASGDYENNHYFAKKSLLVLIIALIFAVASPFLFILIVKIPFSLTKSLWLDPPIFGFILNCLIIAVGAYFFLFAPRIARLALNYAIAQREINKSAFGLVMLILSIVAIIIYILVSLVSIYIGIAGIGQWINL